MHDSTNLLLVNLALSDLLMALATTFQVADFAVKDLNLGEFWHFQFSIHGQLRCTLYKLNIRELWLGSGLY